MKYSMDGPKEVVIPEAIGGTKVTAIGIQAFAYQQLTSVKIPDSVSVIGDSAFSKNVLTEIRLPASLIEIGEKAFYSNQLNEIRLPNSLKTIRAGAFVRNLLTKVEVPKGCTVHSEAFDPEVLIERVGEEGEDSKHFDDRVIRDVNYSWTVQFNQEVDPALVTKDNFLIRDAQGKILDGIEPVLMDGSPSKVQMRNHTTFEKNKDYELVVKKGVVSTKGQKMKQNVRMKFRVE